MSPVAGVKRVGDSVTMRARQMVVPFMLAVQCTAAFAQTTKSLPAPSERHLIGLSREEGTAVLAKLEEAQRALKAGKFQTFELLAGSYASFKETEISPREAFLGLPLNQVWRIERVDSNNPLWRPFRLTYAPNGPGKSYWDVEVVLGAGGQLERVTMVYKVPPPY